MFSILFFFFPSADIFVFLLSTRAGGLGINLTAADTVRPAQVYYVLVTLAVHCLFFFFFFNKKNWMVFLPVFFTLSFPSPYIRASFWRLWDKAYRNAFKARGFEHASEGRSCEDRGKEEIRFTLFCLLELLKSPVYFQMLARLPTSFTVYQDTIHVGIYLLPFPPGYILW